MPLMNLAEIGPLVQRRRQALGLSQARLAKLAGLSRATINQLETGTLVDLGAAKLFGLLDEHLDVQDRPGATALATRRPRVRFRGVRFGYDARRTILHDIDFLEPAIDIVRYHHERLDGRGYPHGIDAGELSLIVRVVTAQQKPRSY